MKVFRPTNETHILRIFARRFFSNPILVIRHELTGIENEIQIEAIEENGYTIGNFEYQFAEGGSYTIELKEPVTDRLLYRGKAYATDQLDLENYKLTK